MLDNDILVTCDKLCDWPDEDILVIYDKLHDGQMISS